MKQKLLKTLIIFATGVTLASCGGSGNTKSADEIVTEALSSAKVVTEVDLNKVNGQLSLSAQAIIAKDRNESEDSFVTIPFVWTANDVTKWNFSEPTSDYIVYATPVRGEEDYSFTLTASATFEGVTKTKEITGTVIKNDGAVVTYTLIGDLHEKELDSTQTIEGYVFNAPKANGKGFFVVDDTGIVYIYDKGNSTVSNGNKVRITGKYTQLVGYNSNYQIDITGADATYEVIDTKSNALPVTGAVTLDLANNKSFQRTQLDAAGEMTLYHVNAYLVGFVNSQYNTPAYEYCTTADGKGAYLPWYPGSTEAFTLYGAEYGTFDVSAPLVSKNDGVCNDGQLHDFYFAVYNAKLDNGSFSKYNIVPICYR